MADPSIGTTVNGVTIEYATGADNGVKASLVTLLKAVVKKDVANGHTLEKIHVSATTNGVHGTNSRHYSGQAIDISKVNGKYMSVSYPSDLAVKAIVDALQDEAEKQVGIRENFGPKFIHKHKALKTGIDPHDDHIHFSVD